MLHVYKQVFLERVPASFSDSRVDEEKSMKRLFALVWFGLLSCSVFLTLSLAQIVSGPSMVIPERSFDFGELDEGKVGEHAFRVLNKGNQPLEIKHVNPG
jgi:hypothetical protein